MKIKKIYVKSFGTLFDYTLELDDGVNIIRAGNESGKTTAAEFIKAMLYGINSGVRNIRNNPRKKYMPWGQTSMGGELTVEHNGITYLIIRSFGMQKSDDTVNVINDVTGQRIEEYCTDSPCYQMTGVGVEAFEKTLYLNHLSLDIDGKRGEITDRLIGLSQSGDEDFSYKRGCRILDNAIKEIENPKSGRIKQQTDKLNMYYRSLKDEQEKQQKIIGLNKRIAQLRAEEEELKTVKAGPGKRFYIILAILVVLSALLCFVSLWLGVAGVVVTAFYAVKKVLYIKAMQTTNVNKRLEISKETGSCETVLKELQAFSVSDIQKNIDECNAVIARYEQKLSKLKLARKCLDDAFEKLQQGFGVRLNNYVAEILSVITENKYDGVKVDENFLMTVHCKDGWQSAEFLSDGAYSQIYFSLKMAIVKMLFEDMPLIFDDAFSLYDEKRLKRAMEYLSNCDSQVILFSCRGDL